jgi:colanic acid/amylovoran biosynthesis glycosyltransferase
MRVAFLVRQFPVLSQTFILNQIIGLIERGHDVHIYPLDGAPSEQSKVHSMVEQYHLIERTYYPPSLPQERFWRLAKASILLLLNIHRGSLSCLPLLNVFKYGLSFHTIKTFYEGMSLIDKESYDIVHCQFGSLGCRGLLFRQIGLLQGQWITTFRGFDISQYVQEHGEHIYDQLWSDGDFFLANCDFFKQRAIKLGCSPQKIVVHRSGIDCRKFAFTPRQLPSEGRLRIVTIGRLVEKKGIEYGIRAITKMIHGNLFSDVSPLRYSLEYIIIGDGPLKEDLQSLIQELDVAHVVKLLGWKQQQELIDILNEAHIFLAPSVTADNGDQDAPVNSLKEAMAMGLPVIGTEHGGIPELIEDGVSGFLVPERNTDAIAQKLCYLIEHPEIWSQITQAGRSQVEEKYDIEKLNDELVEIYQMLLDPRLPDQSEKYDLHARCKN